MAAASPPESVRHFRSAIGRRVVYRLFGPMGAGISSLWLLASGDIGVVAPGTLLAAAIGVAIWTVERARYSVSGDRLELRFLFTTRGIPLGSIISVCHRPYECTWADHRGADDFALGTDVLEIRYEHNPATVEAGKAVLPSGVPSMVSPDSRALVSPANAGAFLTAIGHTAEGPSS